MKIINAQCKSDTDGHEIQRINFLWPKVLCNKIQIRTEIVTIKTNILELGKCCMMFSIQKFEVHLHPKD